MGRVFFCNLVLVCQQQHDLIAPRDKLCHRLRRKRLVADPGEIVKLFAEVRDMLGIFVF